MQGPNFREILHRPLPKQSNTCSFKKQNKTPEGECAPVPEKPSLSHFHYGNCTEMGPAGQFMTSLDSSGSVGPAGLKPGLLI